MKSATILGIPYLHLAQEDDYHMCLAHLLADITYRDFFRGMSRRGHTVMMDNGVVETGLPMEMDLLTELATDVEATEMVIPDRLCNAKATLVSGESALKKWDNKRPCDLFAVPQGKNFEEWHACMLEMIKWPITTIGISKFTKQFSSSRADLLLRAPELIDSNKDIHILGCLSISNEVKDLEKTFPGRIRGIDSGIATICTQAGVKMSDFAKEGGRIDVPLNFFARDLDEQLLADNLAWWRYMCDAI